MNIEKLEQRIKEMENLVNHSANAHKEIEKSIGQSIANHNFLLGQLQEANNLFDLLKKEDCCAPAAEEVEVLSAEFV